MQTLIDAVLDLVNLVSPGKIRAIADTVRKSATVANSSGVETLVGTPVARTAVARLMAAQALERVSGIELAGMLVGASEARMRIGRELDIELVWTGPTTRFVPTRRTEQVLLDLIQCSNDEIFLVSFVAYNLPNIVNALNDATRRGIRLRLLLEASISQGGSLSVDPAATMRASVPLAEIYTWKQKPEPFAEGKVHAKVAVVDSSRAFITSANLTGHALEKNMEAGVFIHGGPVPKTLSDHLQALIDVGVIALA